MPSCNQLARTGHLTLGHILSDLGWFFGPVLIGRTAFMPNQRFVVVTKADRDWNSLLLKLVLREVSVISEGGGNGCTAPLLTHTVPPASFWALHNSPIAVCVCERESVSAFCVCECVNGVKKLL